MRLSHVHCQVRDLPAAACWFEQVWQVTPVFHNERMVWKSAQHCIASAANRSFSGDDMLSVPILEAPFEHRSVSFRTSLMGRPAGI
jgi:hypothetical protein